MPIVRFAGGLFGIACLALVIVAGAFGSGDPSLNPASYLAWLYFWPGVSILVLLIGDFWPWFSPWRAMSAVVARKPTLASGKQTWTAVIAFSAFAWLDLASGLSNRPPIIALAALGFTAFVVLPSVALGRSWAESVEPFGRVFAAIGQVSLPQMLRGRPQRRDLDSGWVRVSLLALVLGAALFDALIAAPQWTSLAATISPSALQRASLAFVTIRSAGLAVTVLLLAGLLLVGARLLRPIGSRATRTNAVATALLPIAVSLMAAHNLPALVHLGPRLPTVLIAFITNGVTAAGVSPDVALPISSASPLWVAEMAITVLGFLWSAVFVWRLQTAKAPLDRIADAYPTWAVAAITSGLAIWILYLPAAA
ncbi:MAG: hypothetical protein ACYDHE_10065 [Candidatus Acidiferrales bacterium]